jgi:hypothetical protein
VATTWPAGDVAWEIQRWWSLLPVRVYLIRFDLQHLRKDIRFDWWRMFCVFGLVDFGCLYTPCCWAFTFPHQ